MSMIANQRGLSLVELMVAMLLGLILIFGVSQITISSKQTYTVVNSQSQTQENARVVKHFLGRGLRHAGYWDDATTPMLLPEAGGFEENQILMASNNDSTDSAVLNGTDSITVRFNGSVDSQLRSCLGAVPTESQIVVDRYYVAPAGATDLVPRLMCESQLQDLSGTVISTNTQPLIVGIENLQIEFGIAGAGSITEYVGAGGVTDWREVRSVRYALLTTSNQDATGDENTRTYQLLDGESQAASGDGRMRQVQRDTIFLRNYRG
ncbi:PilW family protein [Marinobacter sp. OP 3.4]|uniref:PilW family protein n=1 Tax=Marinobacter sp. OP 3.4 TaxID=3076501 RepID=UPI002E210EF8